MQRLAPGAKTEKREIGRAGREHAVVESSHVERRQAPSPDPARENFRPFFLTRLKEKEK